MSSNEDQESILRFFASPTGLVVLGVIAVLALIGVGSVLVGAFQ